MGGVRKLFISNIGFERFAENIYNTTKDMKDQSFVDIIACREYLMQQFKFASKLSKVSSISLTDNCELRIRTRDLFISDSSTGILRKFFVGKWRITTTPSGYYHFTSMNVKELGFYSGVWGDGTVHPHISGRSGHGCLGNAEAPLQYYLKIGAIKTLVIYILGYLESVNINDSAGIELGHCKEVALDDEGNVLHDEDGNYKFITNEFNREGDYHISTTSQYNVDKEHHEYITGSSGCCNGCNKLYNMKYLVRTSNNQVVCENCKEHMKTCSICGGISMKVIHDNVNDLDYCDGCCSTWFTKCRLCNDYIFPKLDKDNIEDSLIQLKETRIKKQNIIYIIKDDRISVRNVCDSCMDILKKDKLTIKPVVFNKVKTTKKLASMPINVPYNKYRYRCISCGAQTPIESLVPDNIGTIGYNRGACCDCHTMPSNIAMNTSYLYRLINKVIRRDFIKVTTHIDTNELTVHVLPYNIKAGTWLPRAAFKDQSVWENIKEGEIIKYNIEGRE